MKIANKKLVNSMKKTLLQEVDEQFEHNYSNLEMLFKRNIKKSINKINTSDIDILHVVPAGSFPSGKAESKDIDIIIVMDNQNETINSSKSNYNDTNMKKIGINAKIASIHLSNININKRNSVLKQFNQYLISNKKSILKANKKDVSNAKTKKISDSMIDRLKLNSKKIEQIRISIDKIVKFKDNLVSRRYRFFHDGRVIKNRLFGHM